MGLKIVPDVVKDQELRTLRETDTAHDAARLMIAHDLSALPVVDGAGGLRGIVTQRDIVRRVTAEDRTPRDTPVAQIMTPDPLAIGPDEPALAALETMIERKFRHLPVVSDGKLVGMVSMRDLRHAVGHERHGRTGKLFDRLTHWNLSLKAR